MKTKNVSLLLLLGIVLSIFAFASCDRRAITPTERNQTTTPTAVVTTAVTTSPAETTAPETEPPAETTAPETEPPDDEYTKNY